MSAEERQPVTDAPVTEPGDLSVTDETYEPFIDEDAAWMEQWYQDRDRGDVIPVERDLAGREVEPEDDGDPIPRQMVAIPASAMTMKAPRWLYDLRMPAGAITLLAGREGIGKSTISYDLAAQLTRGELPGEHLGTPRSVGVVASEDSWESVILPRMVAARTDLARVFRIEVRTDRGRYETISAPADLGALADLCEAKKVALVIIDPIMSIIHASLDTHKDREVRQALDPLARFASETGVSVLALIHVNKSAGNDPLNNIMGSRAFGAVARSVLFCVVDPESEREDRFLFGHPKSNLGPKQPTLTYHMIEVKLETGDEVIATSRAVWDGTDDRTIRDALEPRAPGRPTGELATRVEAWVRGQGRTVSLDEIRDEFPDALKPTLDSVLSRLVSREKLTRPIQRHYAAS